MTPLNDTKDHVNPAIPTLPCTVEHYSKMTLWPQKGKIGECLGAKCEAYVPMNNTLGYCRFHQALRAMAHDARRGNTEVRRVLEKLGIAP